MKTAMRELIDWYNNPNGLYFPTEVTDKMTQLLEKEKQQIVKAVNDTFESTSSLPEGRMDTPIDGNDYYNFTFKP